MGLKVPHADFARVPVGYTNSLLINYCYTIANEQLPTKFWHCDCILSLPGGGTPHLSHKGKGS